MTAFAISEVDDPFPQLIPRIAHLNTISPGAGLLEEFLDGAIDLLNADMGNIQLLDKSGCELHIAAQRGFDRHFLGHFRSVRADSGGTCGAVLASRKAVIVKDVTTDRLFETHREVVADAGYLSVQSTPIFASGALVGVVSTHFQRMKAPTEEEMETLALYTAIAGRRIASFERKVRLLD